MNNSAQDTPSRTADNKHVDAVAWLTGFIQCETNPEVREALMYARDAISELTNEEHSGAAVGGEQ